MKKLFFTLAAGMMFSSLSFAGTTPTVEMTAYKVSDSNAVRVIVVSAAEEPITILIKDRNGNVIYKDVIQNHARFSRKYLFSDDLQNEDYTIEVLNTHGSVNQDVTL